jgi:hypothetical protein
LLNAEKAAYLASRRLHPTQRFTPRRDGTTWLTMTGRGTTELAPWVLSLGPYVKVLRPRSLRDEVHESLKQAGELHACSSGGRILRVSAYRVLVVPQRRVHPGTHFAGVAQTARTATVPA